ncbi:MAG: SDR family NAD(P)-dependent oxidoreductase [Eubacteriaceae bacterium]|jgi:short-subunit dehydrogenase
MDCQNRKTALITGASGGIGFELARCFAADGHDLVLAGSSMKRLEEAAKKLREAFDVSIVTIEQDLSRQGAALELYRKVREEGLEIEYLVNNAGFGTVGPAEKIDFEQDERLLFLNVVALTELCKLFLPEMYRRGSGKILNTASTGAFQPGPFTASYFSSKTYVLSYSRAIRLEARKHGVQVCALCPGTTRTAFFEKEGMETPVWAMSPAAVARAGYRGLMHNHGVIVPGLMNQMIRIVPSSVKAYFVARMKS